MKNTMALLLFSTCFRAFDARAGQDRIKELVEGIAQEGVVYSKFGSYSEQRTVQWGRFEELSRIADDRELDSLTGHPNAAVRCYAFRALAEREDFDIMPLLLTHLRDTSQVWTFECVESSEAVGDYFLSTVLYRCGAERLDKKQMAIVDSVMIFDKQIRLEGRSYLLRRLKPETKYYDRVKELVVQEGDNSALVALARFQNRNDTGYIFERLRSADRAIQVYGLWAVRYFPDPTFFPLLTEIHDRQINRNGGILVELQVKLYKAIVQYKNAASRELIEKTLTHDDRYIRKSHSRLIWLALDLYPDPVYAGIKEKIKLKDFEREKLGFWIERTER